MIKNLRRKFIAVSMLSTLLVLTVIIGIINILNYRNVVRDAEHILLVLSENDGRFPPEKPPGEGESSRRPPDSQSPAPGTMSPELPYESRYFSVLLDEKGGILSVDTGKIAAVDTEAASAYAMEIWKQGSGSGFLSDYRYLRQNTGTWTRLIFLDCSRNLSTFRSFLVISFLVSLLGLCAVFVLVLFFSGIVLKPVSESQEKQRRFITDAGHEIKTPLTIIDANTEILELEQGDSEWLQSIRRQTLRLSSLTNDLIYLSRMEEPGYAFPAADFSISALTEEMTRSFQPLASAQGKSLTARISPQLFCHGHQDSIRQLLSILLDNALKYSTPQGAVEITLQKKGKNIHLAVRNTAEHISEEELPRLFERFYRTDPSRNSRTGGHGIGLSIAKAIVDTHKGKISAIMEKRDFLCIHVIL